MAEIGIQYCGLALISLLIYFTYRRKNLGLYSDRTYHLALAVAFVCLLSDVLSIHALAHMDLWPFGVVIFVCRLYISSLMLVAFLAFTYIASDALRRNERRVSGTISGIIAIAGAVIIWVAPIYVHSTKGELYTYGPAVAATYVFSLVFVFSTIAFAITSYHYVNRRRLSSVLAWMIIWLVAALIQYFNNSLPMVGFATALGLTILFADLENPDSYIDRETGVFTAHALMSLMSQRFEEEQTFAGINIVINMEEDNLTRLMQRTMLVTVARRLELIPNATVFRNVANEFALVLPDAETMEQQLPIIRAMLEEPIDTEDGPVIMHPYYILFPDSTLANSADEVFAYHSFFMAHDPEVDYRVIDEQEVKRIREELAIRNEISEALRDNRVEVHFHPIYSVKTGKFTSAEALARIRRKDGTLLMPGAFIPVAETSNQIIHVGEAVFEKVCQFLSQNALGAYGLEYIEVNLSVEQCERKTLADEFIEIMNRYHVDPSCINLEVTESGSVRNRKTLLENMNKLIEAGVHFSLDDFGTGESNLDYIVNMPVNIVKFDRYFTQAYFTTERTKYVIDSVIEMIRGLDLQIVSEGVETQEQFDTLVEHNIDYIQGYYFAKPMPVDDFIFFIKTH